MTTFTDFHQWLFPGEAIPSRVKNPQIPDKVRPLLEEVAKCTGIPMSWIEKTAGLTVNGLAGLQCLWYLHGLSGEIEGDERKYDPDDESRLPKEMRDLKTARWKELNEAHGWNSHVFVRVHWEEGVIEEAIQERGGYYDAPVDTPKAKVRTTKLGKWLKKRGASQSLLHAFETREIYVPVWRWEISAHPFDVLTMSYRRPWTSCMRPPDPESSDLIARRPGEHQYGPLTDLAAGSAVMFFYHPGAKKPCGRRMLRPVVVVDREEPNPMILDGGRTYGCGPHDIPVDTLDEFVFPVADIHVTTDSLCALGSGNGWGYALTRYVYSDTERGRSGECGQTDEQYEDAYEMLARTGWPDPKLNMSKLRSLAEEYKGKIEFDDGRDDSDQAGEDIDINALQEDVWRSISLDLTLQNALRMLEDSTIINEVVSERVDEHFAALVEASGRMNLNDTSGYIYDDVTEYVKSSIKEYLNDIVREAPLDVYIVPDAIVGGEAPKSAAKKEFQQHEYDNSIAKFSVMSMRDRRLGDFEEKIHKALKKDHANFSEISTYDRVVVIPRVFSDMFEALTKAAILHIEVDPVYVGLDENDWI